MASNEHNDAAVRNAVSTYHLSTRGAVNFTGENPWESIEKALNNPWTSNNPAGTIVMRLAENSLMHDEVANYLRKELPLAVERIQHLTYGQGPRGSVRLRKAVAALFNSEFGAREPVSYDQIIVMSGVTSVTDALVWSVCNEGDGVLIPQPLYTGYHIDVSQRSRGVIIPVPFYGVPRYTSFDDAFDPDVVRRAFQDQLALTKKDGRRVKAVLLTNPHNPLGRCYPEETIKEIAKFCAANDLHLISNEIYAGSVFDTKRSASAVPFSSALSLDLDGIIDPLLVHVAYGASKDFCANGLRLGVLQTRNAGVLESVASLSPFSWTPYVIQDIWAGMLEDAAFRTGFVERNHELMAKSYALATSLLDRHGIPYYNGSNAGVFLWVDLRKYFLADGDADMHHLRRSANAANSARYEEREAFIDATCMKHGVSIARGSLFFTEEWGWFRLTFTLPLEELRQGIERMCEALSEVQRHGWGLKGVDKVSV